MLKEDYEYFLSGIGMYLSSSGGLRKYIPILSRKKRHFLLGGKAESLQIID